jgi:hypothetical protein
MRKLAYKRNAGNFENIAFTNLKDVELLNKLGFSVNPNEYLFLARRESPENIYTYIEKAAGIPESVSKAIDKNQAFSAEYLKELDYKVPDRYEVKGDLVVPIEKKAEEPLPSNFFKLSNGEIIDLDNISWTFRGPTRNTDYAPYYTPKKFKDIHKAQADIFTDKLQHYVAKGPKGEDIPYFYRAVPDGTEWKSVPGSAQTKHVMRYFYDSTKPKPNLPENFTAEIVDAFGRDKFVDILKSSINGENTEKNIINGIKERFKEMGANVDAPLIGNPITPIQGYSNYDLYEEAMKRNRQAQQTKPTFFQKLKNYRKPIAIGAGLSGLAALGYYLHKRKNENAQQNKELDISIQKQAAADHPLKSTNIKAVGYDKKEKTMEVEFHSGGTYKYNNVPKNLFDRIKRVKSPGKFFHKHIRKDSKFEYNKINLQEESL